jgi:hypothetical protein
MKIEAMARYPGSLRMTRPPTDENLVQLQGKISALIENIQELMIPRPGQPQVWCIRCYTKGHLVNECIILKKQLRTLKMGKDDTVATFFSKIAQIKDQLIAIGVHVDDDDLVQTAFDGLPDSWGVFHASVNGRESQPKFERLWHDCLEEEGRLNSRNDHSTLKDHDLAAKTKKWKQFPKSKGKGKKPQGKLSHPKCAMSARTAAKPQPSVCCPCFTCCE